MSDLQIYPIVGLSLQIAFFAMLFALPVAVFVGFILARWRFRGRWILNAVVYLPLVLPPVVTGFILLQWFGPASGFAQFLEIYFHISFGFRWTGAALAAAVMAFPLMVRPIKLAFEAIDEGTIEMANVLGAKPWMVFATVSLPLALPGILAGLVMGFAKALAEFGATITFVSNIPGETRTIALGIYSLMQSPDGEAMILQLIAFSLGVSLIAIIGSEAITQRSLSRWRNSP